MRQAKQKCCISDWLSNCGSFFVCIWILSCLIVAYNEVFGLNFCFEFCGCLTVASFTIKLSNCGAGKMVPPRFLNHFFGVFLSSREMFLISVHKGTPPAAPWPPVFPGELSSHLVSFNSSFFPPFSRTGDIQKCCNLRLFSPFCSLIFNVFVLTDSHFPAWRDFFKKRKRI